MYIDKWVDPIKNFFSKEEEEVINNENIKKIPGAQEPDAVEAEENLVTWNLTCEPIVTSLKNLILEYRRLAITQEVRQPIQEIVNQCVVYNDDNVVNINLDKTDFSDSIKSRIQDEFTYILGLLEFNSSGDEIFKDWYVDGRLYYQNIINEKHPQKGILKLNKLSPLDITRFKDPKTGKYFYIWKQDERYRHNKYLSSFSTTDEDRNKIYKVPEQLITFVPSGLTNEDDDYYISYLHASIKPYNQLKLIEDSAIIYRLTRAPERRIFYIDVGKLGKKKGEAYMRKLINKFKNKVSYDSSTGKMNQSKASMTLIEDFYIPRNSDQKGTSIDTLQNGNLIDKIDDILYFQKKLYGSLIIPSSRIDSGDEKSLVNLGRAGEITREELNFDKFCNKLKNTFSNIFRDLTKKQLLLKRVITSEEWANNKQKIKYDWENDSYFTEMKETEIWKDRIELADSLTEYVGKYISNDTLRKKVFKQTDEEIKDEDKLIEEELKTDKYKPEEIE